jgi:hypothetical protein
MSQEALLIIAVLAVLLAIAIVVGMRMRTASRSTMSVYTSLERIRDVGELTVLTAYIKEVVTMTTEKNSLFTSAGKIILICGFDIEFRYDLKKVKISQTSTTPQTTVLLPPHFLRVIPKETQFYDERKAALLGVLRTDFTVEQRNELLQGARERAVEQAGVLQGDLQEKVRTSAKATIAALAEAFGAPNVIFVRISANLTAYFG